MTTLGKPYKDTVTKFVGWATARIEYLNGSPQVLLEAKDNEGRVQQQWFEEARLEPN